MQKLGLGLGLGLGAETNQRNVPIDETGGKLTHIGVLSYSPTESVKKACL